MATLLQLERKFLAPKRMGKSHGFSDVWKIVPPPRRSDSSSLKKGALENLSVSYWEDIIFRSEMLNLQRWVIWIFFYVHPEKFQDDHGQNLLVFYPHHPREGWKKTKKNCRFPTGQPKITSPSNAGFSGKCFNIAIHLHQSSLIPPEDGWHRWCIHHILRSNYSNLTRTAPTKSGRGREMKQTNHSHLIQLSKATPVKKPRGTRHQQGTVPVASETAPPGAGASNPPSFDVSMTAGICPSRLQCCEGFFWLAKKGIMKLDSLETKHTLQ